MKSYTIFECEMCGKTSRDSLEILLCECRHLNLTLEEKMEYDSIKSDIEYCVALLSYMNNDEVSRNLAESRIKLAKFERKHDIVKV